MILPDVNLLLYAEDVHSPMHQHARGWWRAQLSGTDTVCLCWPVLGAFIRLATNRRVFLETLTLNQACARVHEWLQRPQVRIVQATQQHWSIFREQLEAAQCIGNLVTDAHLAALAIEHGCELCSTDADFARFPRLKWRNPLA